MVSREGSRCYVLERKKEPCKSTTKKVLNGHTLGFHPQSQKLELHTKYIVPRESTAEDVSFEWQHHGISSTD